MKGEMQFGDDVRFRCIDDGDSITYLADLGNTTAATVDVVAGTVIVVTGDDQYEAELPEEGDAEAFIKNGVVTIEVDQ
jgi:hypothetical protein